MNGTAIAGLIFTSVMSAQVDSSALRARFGAPLNRETFTVRPGIEMVVDYSTTSTHACRLEFPGEAPFPPGAAPGVGFNLKKLMDDVVDEIVPAAMRGKELGRMCESSGMNGMCSRLYEHLSIIESMTGDRRTAVIVRFKTADCLK
jgi:hypothetical protein